MKFSFSYLINYTKTSISFCVSLRWLLGKKEGRAARFPDFGCPREVESPVHTRVARGPAWQDLKLGNMFWGSVLSVLCLQESSREAASSPEDSA